MLVRSLRCVCWLRPRKRATSTWLRDYVLDTTGSVTLLNTVAQGAAVTQRVGKKIVMKGLQCRGNLQNGSTANSNDVAFMIVYDKRPTGALRPFRHPRLGFVVGDEQRRQHGSFQHPEASRRHPDRKPDCSGQLTEATVKSCDWWLDLTSKPVVYKAAGTGAIGDIEEGALYLVTVGQVAAGTAAAAMRVAFRLRFLDV